MRRRARKGVDGPKFYCVFGGNKVNSSRKDGVNKPRAGTRIREKLIRLSRGRCGGTARGLTKGPQHRGNELGGKMKWRFRRQWRVKGVGVSVIPGTSTRD